MTINHPKRASKGTEMIPHQEAAFEPEPPIESSELEEDQLLPRFDKERFYLFEIRQNPYACH